MTAMLIALGLYEAYIISEENRERQEVLNKGISYSRSVGKPLLIVGRPKNRHFCGDPAYGDICVDSNPAVLKECPETGMVANIEQPLSFKRRYFGAGCIMHVLEHVDHPVKALQLLAHVCEVIYIAYPKRDNPLNWLHPEHKWIIDIINDEVYVTPISPG